jgi:hypothetical protein
VCSAGSFGRGPGKLAVAFVRHRQPTARGGKGKHRTPPTHWFINFITKWHHCQLNNGLPRFACKNGLTQKSVGGHAMADSMLLNALDAPNTENLACLEELGGKRTNF